MSNHIKIKGFDIILNTELPIKGSYACCIKTKKEFQIEHYLIYCKMTNMFFVSEKLFKMLKK